MGFTHPPPFLVVRPLTKTMCIFPYFKHVAYGSNPEGDSLGLLRPAGARTSFSQGKGLYCLHHLEKKYLSIVHK